MAARVAGAAVGLVFGLTLSWTRLIDPELIHRGLLFEDLYLMLLFASALAVAFAGTQLLRRLRPRALLTGERVEWTTEAPSRRRLGGAVVFGVGWAVAGACPGPIVAQVGQGIAWGLPTLAGVIIGIVAYQRLVAPSAAPSGSSQSGPGTSAQTAATR